MHCVFSVLHQNISSSVLLKLIPDRHPDTHKQVVPGHIAFFQSGEYAKFHQLSSDENPEKNTADLTVEKTI